MKKEIIIYQSKSGKIEFRGDLKKDTIWGNLNQISELFGRDKSVISRHIKNIFKSNELREDSTVAKIATVQKEGKREIKRKIEYYNLDAILSVGYRVNSKQATQFRIWATKTLKKHLLESWTINKKQLAKNKLSDNNSIITATIQDEEFIKKVENSSLSFSKGDILKCKVREEQKESNGNLKSSYYIEKVLEHTPSPKQLDLM